GVWRSKPLAVQEFDHATISAPQRSLGFIRRVDWAVVQMVDPRAVGGPCADGPVRLRPALPGLAQAGRTA
ncbi:MAG: hypothetical protein ACO3YS_01190, partial [Burkholderiaceae bacterium]